MSGGILSVPGGEYIYVNMIEILIVSVGKNIYVDRIEILIVLGGKNIDGMKTDRVF
jgi:hypothetical protein